MVLKSQSSLLVSVNSLDYAKGKLDVRFKAEDPESDEMKALINSIKEMGILNPLHIRPKGNGRYDVLAGNRRLVAAKSLSMEYVPATIQDTDIVKARRLAWIDNEIRLTSAPIEKAKGIAHMYEDIGIPRKVAIQKVKHMYNLKMNHPEEYDDLVRRRTKNPDGSNNKRNDPRSELTEPTPEFIDAFVDIAVPPNTQYQLLQTIVQLPESTLEILEKAPKLGMDKAVALTHSKLKVYPEVIRESLAEQIIDPKINVHEARHLVNQTIADLEAGRTRVTEDGHIDYGYGSGKGNRSEPDENIDTPQELEEPFDVQLLSITSQLMTSIGKILHIQVPRGGIGFEPSSYKPALEEFQKNLESIKKDKKIFCAEQAAIMGRICKLIVDSVK